jgi:hypothetical protein
MPITGESARLKRCVALGDLLPVNSKKPDSDSDPLRLGVPKLPWV